MYLEPYITRNCEKGNNSNPKPIYLCKNTETMKGRTETQNSCTQNPILPMILRKGRTETRNSYASQKRKKSKKEKKNHGLIL